MMQPGAHPRLQQCKWPTTKHHPRASTTAAAAAVGRRAVLGGLCCCSSAGCACSRRQWYDKYFAYNMAVGMEDYEVAVQPVKQLLFSQLLTSLPQQQQQQQQLQQQSTDKPSSSSSSSPGAMHALLEVGIGTGPNLPFYSPLGAPSSGTSSSDRGQQQQQQQQQQQPPLLSVTGLEPNTAMWSYAQQAAAAAGMEQQQLQLVEGDAQQMPFENNSFDAAVMTLVLCSVPQPQAVLAELLRVLKPGGQLLLIEHVIAPQLGLLQLQQRLLDPLQRLLADNCHLTRDTAALLQDSSFIPQPLPPLPPLIKPDAAVVAAGAGAAGFGITGTSGFNGGGHSNNGNGGVDGGGVDGALLSNNNKSLPGGVSVSGQVDLWRFEVEGMGLIAPHVAGILKKQLL